jgi:hypothetical protein
VVVEVFDAAGPVEVVEVEVVPASTVLYYSSQC